MEPDPASKERSLEHLGKNSLGSYDLCVPFWVQLKSNVDF